MSSYSFDVYDSPRVQELLRKYKVVRYNPMSLDREDYRYVMYREELEREAAAMAAKEVADKKKNEKFIATMMRMTTDPEWVKAREARLAFQQKFAAKLAAE